jgi:hypothetical protein
MSELYGTDLATPLGDLLPGLPDTSGPEVVLQDLVRRFETPNGFLHQAIEFEGKTYPWDPKAEDYGYDLQLLVGKKIRNVAVEENRIAAECMKDDRVENAQVSVNQVGTDRLEITIRVSLVGLGPFEFVLAVTELGIEVFYGA